MNEIVERIYELIAKSGISKTELSKRIGVSKNMIQYWKKENALPALSVIERICETFNITVEQFFCGMGAEYKNPLQDKFLDEWRLLNDKEKAAVKNCIAAFKANKAVHND